MSVSDSLKLSELLVRNPIYGLFVLLLFLLLAYGGAYFVTLGQKHASEDASAAPAAQDGFTVHTETAEEFVAQCRKIGIDVAGATSQGLAAQALREKYPRGYVILASNGSQSESYEPHPDEMKFVGSGTNVDLSGSSIVLHLPDIEFGKDQGTFRRNTVEFRRQVGLRFPIETPSGSIFVEVLSANASGVILAVGVP